LTISGHVKYIIGVGFLRVKKQKGSELKSSIVTLKNIGKTQIGTIAEVSGKALNSISHPLALKIYLHFTGLEPEVFTAGNKRLLSYLAKILKIYGFEGSIDKAKSAQFISVSTTDDKIICLGTIRHLGNILGYISAIGKESESVEIPLQDGLYLVMSQIESKINSILAPGSRSSLEITGRRLLIDLHDLGVFAVCIRPSPESHIIISLFREQEDVIFAEVDEFPVEDFEDIHNGSLLDESNFPDLWPGFGNITAGFWAKDPQDRLFAFGFTDKKLITKATKEKIYSSLEAIAEIDIENIIKSFEKLKTSFKKMVKSERAAAITETAVTVNHEINNPLTAILGNTQLLLMNKNKLPKETITKLQTIEKSALKIRETTNKLMTIIDPVTTHYTSGLEMIDIEKSKKKPPEK